MESDKIGHEKETRSLADTRSRGLRRQTTLDTQVRGFKAVTAQTSIVQGSDTHTRKPNGSDLGIDDEVRHALSAEGVEVDLGGWTLPNHLALGSFGRGVSVNHGISIGFRTFPSQRDREPYDTALTPQTQLISAGICAYQSRCFASYQRLAALRSDTISNNMQQTSHSLQHRQHPRMALTP
eukprot:2341645-Rhodomonas_salina.1